MSKNAVTFSNADKAQRAAAAAAAAAPTAAQSRPVYSSGTEDRVNAWLRDDSTDIAPLRFVIDVAEMFLDDVDRFDLSMSVDRRTFEQTLCHATGAYYLASDRNKTLLGPSEIRNAPRGWTADAENVWNDYVSHYYFNDVYWIHFWDEMPVASWEHSLPQWRIFLQTVLTWYLQRDAELLIEADMLMVNSDGNFVSPDSEFHRGGEEEE